MGKNIIILLPIQYFFINKIYIHKNQSFIEILFFFFFLTK